MFFTIVVSSPAVKAPRGVRYGWYGEVDHYFYNKAGLPASTYPAFKEAIEAMREGGFVGEPGGVARLKRRMIERVLTRCESEQFGELAPLITLLHRFATEAAREEARLFCDELVAGELEDRQSVAA